VLARDGKILAHGASTVMVFGERCGGGATGAILATRLIHSMRRDGLKRGIGGGQGIGPTLPVSAWCRQLPTFSAIRSRMRVRHI